MTRLQILTLVAILLSIIIFSLKKKMPSTIAAGKGLVIKKEWLAVNKNPITPQKDCRPADQTFLTFPEWFLVFSPEEQANYFKEHTSTSFPYTKHTAQIWQSYRIVKDQIRGNFPVNRGYHFMIWVIGTSASVEYVMKAIYETIVGRITDTKTVQTEEDKFNSVYTQDYVDFIKDRPWYEFDFKKRLKYLWREVPFSGKHFFRKIDRRYILTSELLVKWGYGKLIGLGTKTVYDEALPTTAVLYDSANNPGTPVLAYLPRYDKFAAAVVDLAKKGFQFKEIAGNNSAILLTILTSSTDTTTFENSQIVFRQPVASNLTMQRIALAVPVADLHQLLLQLEKDNVFIEHVFDY
ncbi:MAG: hypothetical protein QM726_06310 [Chitinophagaceae bacterium]